jgi:phosphatidylserine decarboxylase
LFQYLYRCFIELTNNKMTSLLLKHFSQSRLSKPIIPLYIKAFRMNLSDSKDEFSSFATLHDLFTRSLQTGARPIAEGEQSVSSPVDGVLEDYGSIQEDTSIIVKDKTYSIKEMLSNDKALKKYLGGKYIVLYLSPSHYHRIHSPISGKVLQRWTLGQKSYPVNKWGMKYGKAPLSKNYRMITEMQHERCCVAIVKVGAMFVNSIEITDEAKYLKRGQEFSYFSFGSTVVLLFEKDCFELNDALSVPEKVRVGEKLGELKVI